LVETIRDNTIEFGDMALRLAITVWQRNCRNDSRFVALQSCREDAELRQAGAGDILQPRVE
jgi:hypothetical protein